MKWIKEEDKILKTKMTINTDKLEDFVRRILALPPKGEGWVTFHVSEKKLKEKGWEKPIKAEIVVNENEIIIKKRHKNG